MLQWPQKIWDKGQLINYSVLIKAWRKCGRIYASTRIREVNYARVLNLNKSLITSIYIDTMSVWCLWFHRVGPKNWHFAYAEDYGDRANLRCYAKWILSMVGHVAPTKSFMPSINTATTLVWCIWFHRVGPKKWHFAYTEDYWDRAHRRCYAKWILSMVGHVPPTKSLITSIYTTTTLVWCLRLQKLAFSPKRTPLSLVNYFLSYILSRTYFENLWPILILYLPDVSWVVSNKLYIWHQYDAFVYFHLIYGSIIYEYIRAIFEVQCTTTHLENLEEEEQRLFIAKMDQSDVFWNLGTAIPRNIGPLYPL